MWWLCGYVVPLNDLPFFSSYFCGQFCVASLQSFNHITEHDVHFGHKVFFAFRQLPARAAVLKMM